ncbi:MAG: carbamoyltransferase [Tepidisphaeraceae bacterium]
MSTRILGISAFYHDSAAALLVDGEIVAAAQEERFTRKKHDHRFPVNAVKYCLEQANLTPVQLDYVGFYDKPRPKFDRLVTTLLAFAPASFQSYVTAVPQWLRSKLHLQAEISRALDGQYRGPYLFADHHESHAASAFFPSPFEEAAILTMDGVGEWATTTLGHGKGNTLHLLREIRFPHSLGLLYSAFTYYTGFRVNSGEYKVMGLAPYGEPKYAKLITDHLIRIRQDGSFWMDMSYFNYCQGFTMTGEKFHRLMGGPPRKPETRVTQREMDLAASVQVVCEDVVLRCARHVHKLTGSKNLVMAGGVALNCVANGRIVREGPFENLWVQPASGDAGGALGVAQLIWHHVLSQPRKVLPQDSQLGSYLGPRCMDHEIRQYLDSVGAKYRAFENEDELLEKVASMIADDKVIGWVQGRMEFGPRALGARSILGDPRSEKMQQVMNLKIKFRESFRPFAPSVLREHCLEYFDLPAHIPSPYMLVVAPVIPSQRDPNSTEAMRGRQGIDRLNIRRSTIPAVTHVDFSARVQTVDEITGGRYYRLLKRFKDKTGCPVMINTSFNIRGEPIVCTASDAYRCFMGTHMDVLVLEDCVLLKDEQPKENLPNIEQYKASFKLD